MGSASRILTVVVELGLVMTIAGMLYGSSAPALANINPPTFDNPFDHGVTVSLGLRPPWGNNYTSSPGNVTAFSNESGSVRCTNATMYACLDDPQNANNGTTRSDGNFTYVHLNHGFAIRLNLTGNLAQGQVKNGQVRFWCRAFDDPDSNYPYIYLVVHAPGPGPTYTLYLDDFGSKVQCTKGGNFVEVDATLFPYTGPGSGAISLSSNPNPPNLALDIIGYGIEISTIETTLFITGYSGACANPDFFTQTGCQISQFIDSLINWIQWIGAGLRFIFSWGGQFIVFLMSIISLFLWLYAIPQLPGPIQLVFSVWVTGNLIYLVYTIAATLRGFPAE